MRQRRMMIAGLAAFMFVFGGAWCSVCDDNKILFSPAEQTTIAKTEEAEELENSDSFTPDPQTEEAPVNTVTAPTATASPRTIGGCKHGAGESLVYLLFFGFAPGDQIAGTIDQSPDGGLIDEAAFQATAGPEGIVRVQRRIQSYGDYMWSATYGGGQLTGSFTVEADNCTGPPTPTP